ncbi:MAG TPA: hypothetical protein VFP47_20970 [Pyrinomonadaceae bacterium]|nr:hypothetical protein [Pyrinomonadaceae bacterium]
MRCTAAIAITIVKLLWSVIYSFSHHFNLRLAEVAEKDSNPSLRSIASLGVE